MPKRYKPKTKKKTYSKYKKQIYKPYKGGLLGQVIPFTRETETYFRLNDLTGANGILENFVHTTDGGAVGQISVKLNMFAGHTLILLIYSDNIN